MSIPSLNGERWKAMPGFEGYYEISNKGRVKSIFWSGRILKPMCNGNGYMYFTPIKNKDGDKRNYYIHRAVAETFISNPLNKEEVNHKNLNKSDNRIDNLEWVTRKENARHARRNIKFKVSNIQREKLISRNKKMSSRPLINANSGKIYPSIIAASKDIGISYSRIKYGLKTKDLPFGLKYIHN